MAPVIKPRLVLSLAASPSLAAALLTLTPHTGETIINTDFTGDKLCVYTRAMFLLLVILVCSTINKIIVHNYVLRILNINFAGENVVRDTIKLALSVYWRSPAPLDIVVHAVF